MRVLVCGGRDYVDRDRLFTELDALSLSRGVTIIISDAHPVPLRSGLNGPRPEGLRSHVSPPTGPGIAARQVRTNANPTPYIDHLDLPAALDQAATEASRSAFGHDPLRPFRPTPPVRHPGDLGTVFGTPQILPTGTTAGRRNQDGPRRDGEDEGPSGEGLEERRYPTAKVRLTPLWSKPRQAGYPEASSPSEDESPSGARGQSNKSLHFL